MRNSSGADDDLAELRELVEQSSPIGQCALHPERHAARACAHCGALLCEDCEAATPKPGLCQACAEQTRRRALELGRKLAYVAQALGLILTAMLFLSLLSFTAALWLRSVLWGGLLGSMLLAVAAWRGNEWAHAGLLTFLGVGGLVCLNLGELLLGGLALPLALVLLHPATGEFLESQRTSA